MKTKLMSTMMIGFLMTVFLAACGSGETFVTEDNPEDGNASEIKQITIYNEGAVTPYGCTYSWIADLEDQTFTYAATDKEANDPTLEGYVECATTWSDEIQEWEVENFTGLAADAGVSDHGDVEASGDPAGYCLGSSDVIVTVEFSDGTSHDFTISGSICDLSEEDEELSDLLNYIYSFHVTY